MSQEFRGTPLDDAVAPAQALGRAIFSQSPFSTVLYELQGRIVAANAAFERLFGFRTSDIPADYSVVDDPQLGALGLLPDVRRVFERGETVVLPLVPYDSTYLRPGGGTRTWTQGHFFPLRDAAGKVATVVLMHVDLTDRVLAEQALRASEEEARQQTIELEAQAEQMQDQALELESQQQELEQQIEQAHVLAEELSETNAALVDANAREAAERAAAERAATDVRAILESIADPFVVYDAEWRFRYINAPAAALFAQSRPGAVAELLGKVVWDEYADLVGGGIEREIRRAAAERQPRSFAEFHPATGTWSEVRCFPMPDGGLATTWTDITERKRAEEAAHYVSEATAILSSSLDYEVTLAALARLVVPQLADWCAVYVVDDAAAGGAPRQIAVAHVDPAKVAWARDVNRRFPLDPDAPTGVPNVVRTGRAELVSDITDAMLESAIDDPEHRRLVRGLGLREVMTVPLAIGERVLGAMSLVAAESGRRYGEGDLALAKELARRAALAIENARLHREALAARAAAEAANRAKGDFLATMSHELRTPLNAIGGYAQLLAMGVRGPITDAQRADLERIERSQRHLLGLINDVLNYAKLEAARVEYHIAPLALRSALAGLEDLVAPLVSDKGLRYECVEPAASLVALADEEKLRQILLNLLSNAVKFTAAGGRVRVTAERGAGGNFVRIRVADTGVGIPAEKHQAVFEPFVQLARGLSSGHEGTGLGLAISRDLARGMGGDLTVESEVGVGSTFTLTLPAAR